MCAHLSPCRLPRELPLDLLEPVREDARLADAMLPSDEPLSPDALPLGTAACTREDAYIRVHNERVHRFCCKFHASLHVTIRCLSGWSHRAAEQSPQTIHADISGPLACLSKPWKALKGAPGRGQMNGLEWVFMGLKAGMHSRKPPRNALDRWQELFEVGTRGCIRSSKFKRQAHLRAF